MQIAESVCKELVDWHVSQPAFIQKLCMRSMNDCEILSIYQNGGNLSTVA